MQEFFDAVQRTSPPRASVQIDENTLDLIHGTLGLSTEAGELLDIVKKFVFYNKQPDIVNLEEELGDVMWYIVFLCSRLGLNIEKILLANIEKLKIRFPEKFTEDNANERNLDLEREALEKNVSSSSSSSAKPTDSEKETDSPKTNENKGA